MSEQPEVTTTQNLPKVLAFAPTWSGGGYALKAWADAYHAQTYPADRRGAFMVDNSDGPQTGGNLHHLHKIRAQGINAIWQTVRWPVFWDTMEQAWLLGIEYAHSEGYDMIFSIEHDVVVPDDAMAKMVAASYEHGVEDDEGFKPAMVSQRYHPRGQHGPDSAFWWDTLGCTLFPVEPLWQDRLLVKATFEIESAIIMERHGYPRFRPGREAPDLFIPDHLKDPEDNHGDYGGTPAATTYLRRVMAANGEKADPLKVVYDPEKPVDEANPHEAPKTALSLACEPATLDVVRPGYASYSLDKPLPDGPYERPRWNGLVTSGVGGSPLEPELATVKQASEAAPAFGEFDQKRYKDLPPLPLADVNSEAMAGKVIGEGRMRLNIGSDRQQISGFLSVDINPAVSPDFVTSGDHLEMIETGVVDEIYASHVLEHFDWQGGLRALKEWLRVLKPNGMLTVAVPDIEGIWQMYRHGGKWGEYSLPVNGDYVQATIFGSNHLAELIPEMVDLYKGPGMDHKSFYFRDMLIERCLDAGFVQVHETTACFLRGCGIGETMVQARKPIEGVNTNG